MTNLVKNALIGGAVVLLAIQFFRPKPNNSNDETNEIAQKFPVPPDVHGILKTSCYDCHSNNTVYPWYASFQPVLGWLDHHIDEGKHEINFSTFATYSPRRQFKKFNEIIEQVKEGEMPLSSYTLIHRDAVLSADQKQTLIAWAEAMKDTLKAHNPADSLKMPPRPMKH
jgi:Haem-binding domain